VKPIINALRAVINTAGPSPLAGNVFPPAVLMYDHSPGTWKCNDIAVGSFNPINGSFTGFGASRAFKFKQIVNPVNSWHLLSVIILEPTPKAIFSDFSLANC
jgi:hypothetical protein